MTSVQPIRGTQSLLGEDADRLAAVVTAFDRVRRLFGFKRVEVPTIEQTSVFARTIGETTDVVSKEMYSFEDRADQRGAHVAEQSGAVGRGPLQLTAAYAMAHMSFPSFVKGPCEVPQTRRCGTGHRPKPVRR